MKSSGGPAAEVGDTASLLYKVALSREALETGDWLESTYDPELPVEFELSSDDLLAGVLLAVLGMSAGGSVRIARIPSALAYGSRGLNAVPPDHDLWIEVCLGVLQKGA